jgi:SAM-dependent methyltransferase
MCAGRRECDIPVLDGPRSRRTTAALYDAAASQYVQRVGTELNSTVETDFDRAILALTAEALSRRPGLVLDLGCGTGRVAAYLSGRGVNVVGIDVSHGMLASARRAHPGISFVCGSLEEIPLWTGCAVGAVFWYSIIHTPPDGLADLFGEVHRVCRTDAEVLIAFQAGDGERVDRANAYETGQTMTSYRHSLDGVARALTSAGFRVTGDALREPAFDHETTPQAFVTAEAKPTLGNAP